VVLVERDGERRVGREDERGVALAPILERDRAKRVNMESKVFGGRVKANEAKGAELKKS
jgi:hypothetical protein